MIELVTLGRVRLLAGTAESAPPGQPKRIALLAYLAVTGDGAGRRRDELLAAFWPELGDDEARRALRQALYYLRRVLGPDVIVGEGDEVAIRRDGLRCDAVAFEQLVSDGKAEEALAIYQGDFMQGFYVPDVSSEYEEWVERTRARLRRRARARMRRVVRRDVGRHRRRSRRDTRVAQCALVVPAALNRQRLRATARGRA